MVHPYKKQHIERALFGYEAILTRPLLTAHIGAIASIWTVVEETWGQILAECLDAEAKTGIAMYLALTGATSQGVILTQATQLHLPEALQHRVAELRKAEKSVAGERNRVVHGRWGIVPSDDRYLVLGERDWLPKALAHIKTRFRTTALGWKEHPDMKMMLYTEKDFRQIEDRLMAHFRSLQSLSESISAFRREQRLLSLMIVPQSSLLQGLPSLLGTAPPENQK